MTTILDTAKQIVAGDRQQDYGSCVESFERIAAFWSTYLGVAVTAKDVSAMLILMKVSRSKTSDKLDTPVDIAGYAECMGQIISHREPDPAPDRRQFAPFAKHTTTFAGA